MTALCATELARLLTPYADRPRSQAASYPVLSVALSAPVIRRAEAYQEAVLANLPPRPNYCGFEPPNRYRNGFLGEFAFVLLLRALGSRLRYSPRADGRSDDGPDVYVWMGGLQVGVNVRAGGKPTHRYLMLPEAQWTAAASADMYLGARLDLDQGVCELWGTVWREGFAEATVRNPGDPGFPVVLAPTRLIPLRDLEPLGDSLSALDQGPAVIDPAIPRAEAQP